MISYKTCTYLGTVCNTCAGPKGIRNPKIEVRVVVSLTLVLNIVKLSKVEFELGIS